ncbi:MAG: UDP-glucose 4-epimerase [Flavobacteriales bacterium]|nr:UDP-glucose 4-epimerase [Flavobacteriales bacterium]
MFKNKTLMITGGTGSFGNAVINKFLQSDIKEIRIFSRDEKKQDDMRKLYHDKKLTFYIGDVRDRNSLDNAMEGVDFLFNAAALKQVPSCEFFPMEAVKTNIIGIDNVIDIAIKNKVKKVVVLSTDKAVYPINSMGISKAMMEKVAVGKSRNLDDDSTIICCTRYGNVMASRGSVIPLFVNQINNNQNITITSSKMTRFMMSLENAVDLVLHAFKNGKNGDIFVQKSPASTIGMLADVLIEMSGNKNVKVQNIGIRHGEKMYESLLTAEEMSIAEDQNSYYRISSDNRDLNYNQYFSYGDKSKKMLDDYNSNNTHQLSKKELTDLLQKLPEIQSSISDWPH